MITKLEELTAAQFIDLVSGDKRVLLAGREIASEAKLSNAMTTIVFEYRTIVDESGVNSYLTQLRSLIKSKAQVVIFKMCQNLIEVNRYDNVREILDDCGINAGRMSEQRLKAEVKSRLERAKSDVKKFEKDNEDIHDIKDIRKTFDEQTAAMMAHYKFQIDTSTMKATLYAHLVARFNREVKAQMEALKKK